MNTEEEVAFINERQSKLRRAAEATPTFATLSDYARFISDYGQLSESLNFYKRALKLADELALQGDPIATSQAYKNTKLWYAGVLETLGEVGTAREVYEDLLRDPKVSSVAVCNYAIFLHRKLKRHDEAESMYQRAIEMSPNHATTICKYGAFMKAVRGNAAEAERLYRAAIAINPNHGDGLGSLAACLHGRSDCVTETQELYARAVAADPTNTNHLSNYGLFLSEIMQDFAQAEEMYRRAITMDPAHANSLYNYGVLLDSHLGRKQEAEGLYRRALTSNPTHAYALYNLAVLVEEAGNDYDEAAELYERAVDASPDDVMTLADYGRFLAAHRMDYAQAEYILRRALEIEDACETAQINLALLLHRQLNRPEEAKEILLAAVHAHPTSSVAKSHLARCMVDCGAAPDDILGMFVQALRTNPQDLKTIDECVRYAITASKSKACSASVLRLVVGVLLDITRDPKTFTESKPSNRSKRQDENMTNVPWEAVESRIQELKELLTKQK